MTTEATLLPYERVSSEQLQRAIRLREGERLLVLQPFGWHIDGTHIPNAAEQFSREGICAEHRWVVVHDFGPYIAVVRSMNERDEILSALKLAYSWMPDPDEDTRLANREECRQAIEAVKAAIAKGEGR